MADIISLAQKRPGVKYTVEITQYHDGTMEALVRDVNDDEQSRNSVCDALVRLAEVYLNRRVSHAADDMLAILLAHIDMASDATDETPTVFNIKPGEVKSWADAVGKYEDARFSV